MTLNPLPVPPRAPLRLVLSDAARDAWPDGVANRIARHILWFRKLRCLSQLELADLAGVNASSVNHAESGQTQITVRTLLRLAAALQTSAGVLLGEDGPNAEALAADAARRRL